MEIDFQVFSAGFEAGEESMRNKACGLLFRPIPMALNVYEAWREYQKSRPRLEVAKPAGPKGPGAP